MRILLVEDFVDLRTLLAITLGEEGHDIIEAADFTTAATVLSMEGACDAVVADVRLPDGSGIALAELARNAGLPALLCTGDPDAITFLAEQGVYHLRKPFPLDVLTGWISDVAGYASSRRNA